MHLDGSSASRSVSVGRHLRHDAPGLVHRGEKGPAVAELQRALNGAGAHLPVDGEFGPDTERAVMAFQRRARIQVDGVAGPQTVAALARLQRSRPAPTRPPAVPQPDVRPVDPRKSREWNRYARMVRAAGGQVNPGGRPTVLGIRKGERTTTHYADEFVVLLRNGQVRHFTGSTRPAQSTSSASPDVNGDGRGDVAMLRPGTYQVVPNGLHHGKTSFSVRRASKPESDRVAAYRDLDHDGVYSARERRWARAHGITAGEILFHVGFQSPSSIGCMNLTPSNVDAFTRAVGGSRASFSFTLIGQR